MTDRAATPVRATGSPRRKPSLYRTVLSIAIAALVAAWLPFSVLYINALSKHPATTATTVAGTQPASGAGSSQPAKALTPVTTRTS